MDSSAAARASSSGNVFPAHDHGSGVHAQEVYRLISGMSGAMLVGGVKTSKARIGFRFP